MKHAHRDAEQIEVEERLEQDQMIFYIYIAWYTMSALYVMLFLKDKAFRLTLGL